MALRGGFVRRREVLKPSICVVLVRLVQYAKLAKSGRGVQRTSNLMLIVLMRTIHVKVMVQGSFIQMNLRPRGTESYE